MEIEKNQISQAESGKKRRENTTVAGEKFDIYADIETRTKGEIYLGVVGPVRTGKSTFIKRFMDLCVLPRMENDYVRKQTMDELPQSGAGKMITTTEPKFIPKEAARIHLSDGVEVKVRLIDCVGFMVQSALGFYEENAQRMVKTPWTREEIPFVKAAEIGTRKVISDHATIGIVVTTDGSITEIPRQDYLEAEEKAISECKNIGKPFVVLLNSTHPTWSETTDLARELEAVYHTTVLPVNCAEMTEQDIYRILSAVLSEFPLSVIEFYTPKWIELLAQDHPLKKELKEKVEGLLDKYEKMRDIKEDPPDFESEYVKRVQMDECNMASGVVKIRVDLEKDCYYELLSDMTGETIQNEYELLHVLQELGQKRTEYGLVADALRSVRASGYGVVTPSREEIRLEKPEVIRHGNKFGVKIKSNSPSIFMIRANIENEIAPIIGSEQQANELIQYISEDETSAEGMWGTNIFGKTVEQMVNDGIQSKIAMIGEESQMKLQDTMQKIVNDMNGGMVCIII